MHFGFVTFTSSYGIFINTLFMRVTGSSDIVMWYNLIVYLLVGYLMSFAVFYTRKHNMLWSTRIGMGCFLGMYLVLFTVMDHIDLFMPLLAALNALSSGFYWLTYSALISHFTSDNNRDVALALIGLMGGIVNLCVPALAGYVIEAFEGYVGYYIMFGFSFAIALITFLLSFRLPAFCPEAKKTHFKRAIRDSFRNPCWRSGMLTETVKGIREGTFGFFLNVLLFETVQSETLIGINTFLLGVASMISFWAAGKIIRPGNRIKCMMVSTTVLLLACLLLVVNISPFTIILLTIVSNLFGTFIINPVGSSFFLLIQKMPGAMEAQEEYWGIREVFLNFGRAVGVVIVMLFPSTQWGYIIALVLLTFSQYFATFLCKRAITLVNSYSEEHNSFETE